MLRTFVRSWQQRAVQAELNKLANRLGPHLARDVGIDGALAPRVLPTLRPI